MNTVTTWRKINFEEVYPHRKYNFGQPLVSPAVRERVGGVKIFFVLPPSTGIRLLFSRASTLQQLINNSLGCDLTTENTPLPTPARLSRIYRIHRQGWCGVWQSWAIRAWRVGIRSSSWANRIRRAAIRRKGGWRSPAVRIPCRRRRSLPP